MTSIRKTALVALALFVLAFGTALAGVSVDPDLGAYTPVKGVSGNLKSIGSDTMNNEMALWAEGFNGFYPNVQVEIEGKGSSTAPPALIAGTSHFGPMSRPMKSKEVDAFQERFGYEPVQLRTSIDMLAVYVHKDNPIQSLTLQQVDAIFSKTRKGGASEDITTWGQLGLTGDYAKLPISIYGRNSSSGTYGFFKGEATSVQIVPLETSAYALINEGVQRRLAFDDLKGHFQGREHVPFIRLRHQLLSPRALDLSTKQTRIWQAVGQRESVMDQFGRLMSIPGADEATVYQVLFLMERLEFARFADPIAPG